MIHSEMIPPRKIPNLEKVIGYLIYIQNRLCAKCKSVLVVNPYPHHGLIYNTIANRKRWPYLIHSIINLFLICNTCHTRYSMFMQIQNTNIIDNIETYIKDYYVNNMNITTLSICKRTLLYRYKDYINWCETEKKAPNRRFK